MRRNIVVTGATGKQGHAVIKALLHPPPGPELEEYTYHIYALTRNASSPAAKKLAKTEENVTVVEGDLDVPDSVRTVFDSAKDAIGGAIWGVFAVLAYPGLGVPADGEERQGKLLADLALEYGVASFVYSSAMRAGPKYEHEMKLSTLAKGNVERYCVELGERGLNWTNLRPGFFMENFTGFIGSIAAAVLKTGLKPETTNALIASEDIGNVAAAVFRGPEKYRFKTLGVVAEHVTMSQMEEAHQRARCKSMPAIPLLAAWLLLKVNKSTQGVIHDIERFYHARSSGKYPTYEAEVELARSAYQMKTYEEWLRQGMDAGKNRKNWNQVFIGKLVMGKH